LLCEVSSAAPWMELNATTVTLPATIQARVKPTGLREGTVRGEITVRCGAAGQQTRTVAVSLNVQPAQAPRLAVDTEAVAISIIAGTETVERQFPVRNTGSGTLQP